MTSVLNAEIGDHLVSTNHWRCCSTPKNILSLSFKAINGLKIIESILQYAIQGFEGLKAYN